jgi:hypothetical protein
MRKILVIVGISLAFIGCARHDNAGYHSGSAPAAERGDAVMDNAAAAPVVPNASGGSTRLQSEPVPGSTTTFDTNIITFDAATGKGAGENQNLNGAPSPAVTGAQDPTRNSNSGGGAGTTSQKSQ